MFPVTVQGLFEGALVESDSSLTFHKLADDGLVHRQIFEGLQFSKDCYQFFGFINITLAKLPLIVS